MKKAIHLTISALAPAGLSGLCGHYPLRRPGRTSTEHERLYHLVPLRRLLA